MIPLATCRLQFNKNFVFDQAAELADYLQALGISHVYASPILKARSGSPHGYDIVDFGQINPELGGEESFRRMARALRARGIGIVLDIVPNHMAVAKADNAWWRDVLAKGLDSSYAEYFDIDWDALDGKVLAPFLEGSPRHCIETNVLKLIRDERGIPVFSYFDHIFPLRPEDAATLSGRDVAALPPEEQTALLERQHYVLADWHEANSRINWRRFFDITDLAALRMERDEVFDAVHAKTLALYAEGLIDGLRVDHIDGLADPRAYCRELRAALSAREAARPTGSEPGPAYLIIEKILAFDETLSADWGVDGTTGYDFMADMSALLHAPDAAGTLSDFWANVSGRAKDFEPEERLARMEILAAHFSAQADALCRAFYAAAPQGHALRDLRDALGATLAELRCYRTYATGKSDSPPAGVYLHSAIEQARASRPDLALPLEYMQETLESRIDSTQSVDAVRRFNQLAAPVAAKAVEDTAFYRYGRLLSRNDVGSDPRTQSLAISEFHRRVSLRTAHFPHAMLTIATHDHKRGEDARARLAVLSEVPHLWEKIAKDLLAPVPNARELDTGDAYQLLQTVVGAWPQSGLTRAAESAFLARISEWCRKFLREAKLRSAWPSPDTAYEEQLIAFAAHLIGNASLRKSIEDFVGHIAPASIANSIAQTVLRCTVPGVPDLYQGRETWDFSLVDPDNRSAIDYKILQAAQNGLGPMTSDPEAWADGTMKHNLVSRLLNMRRAHGELFLSGSYRPLTVTGSRAGNVVAFVRRHESRAVAVVVAIRCAGALCGMREISPPAEWWGDTEVEFEEDAAYRDLLADTDFSVKPQLAASLFDALPACVLIAQDNHK